MDKEHETTPYAEKFKGIKLSESSRARMKESLESFADFHATTDVERVYEGSRSIEQVSQTSVWYTAFFTRLNQTTMPVLGIMIAVLVGGTTTFAAQNSLPGDTLYPIKISVNENVRAAFAIGADAEADLQTELLEERVNEAKRLAAENKLEGTLALSVQSNIAAQADKAGKANDAVDESEQKESDARILAALNSYNRLTADGSILAIGDVQTESSVDSKMMYEGEESAAMDMDAQADVGVSTMIALEPIDVALLAADVEKRVYTLRDVVERHKSEFDANVYTKLSTNLKDALSLVVQAQAESSDEASRETLYRAADLMGDVESTLSLLGTVKIDTDTGMIIDVDLSTPPPKSVEPWEGGYVDPIREPIMVDPIELEIEDSAEISL